MLSNPIVLLDTNIVAGLFSVSKLGPHVEHEKKIWRDAVRSLILTVSSKCLARVPTPVCYELMSINKRWYSFITTSKENLFQFSAGGINNDVLMKAAEYSLQTFCVSPDGKEQKIKTMDPLIAAYSLIAGHYILTLNQQDFPESHFTVAGTKVITLSGKTAKYRVILYLLKPTQ